MKLFAVPVVLSALLMSCDGKVSVENKPDSTAGVPVTLAAVQEVSGSSPITTSGLITTENEARLSFKIGGLIESIRVQEGQRVSKGQLLATLNSTEISAQVNQAQSAFEKAQRDYQRTVNLHRDSVATLEQLQNSKTGLDIARETLQQLLFNRRYADIHAPEDGFIVRKLHSAGELAGPSAPVLIMGLLGGKNKWVLRAGVADREWTILQPGDKATVTTDAFPGKNFNAAVAKKSQAADPASGSFEIELAIDVQHLQPAVGMFGKAVITPSGTVTGYRIPYEALLEANGTKGFVFITDDRKTVRRIDVSIAAIEEDRVLVADGLKGHGWIVISGSPYLKDGSRIAVSQSK